MKFVLSSLFIFAFLSDFTTTTACLWTARTTNTTARPINGSLIMVATGSYYDKSQLIDVSSSSTACANLPSYPFPMSHAAGGVVNGSPIICGGWSSSRGRTDSCHRFDRNSNSWKLHSTMTSKREDHASTVVKNALFISGGYDGSSRLATTEYIYANGTVQRGPNLPVARYGHCSVTLHDGKVMILGASYPVSLYRNVIIMDPADNTFITRPALSYGRDRAACTLFNSPLHNGRPVVLAAGGWEQTTAEVYDYTYANQWQTIGSLPTTHSSSQGCTWMGWGRQGGQLPPQILADQKAQQGSGGAPHYYLTPRLHECFPSSFWGARALPSTTGNGAYLQMNEFLYELSCTTSWFISSCKWSEMTQQLSTSVYNGVMMYLPDSFNCTN